MHETNGQIIKQIINMKNQIPIIAWFSCGATSAVACKIALANYQNVRVVYIDTGSGHKDNLRFIRDCEKWYNQKIEIIHSTKYKNVFDVIKNKRYINGVKGASCTYYLKKEVRYEYEKNIKEWQGQVYGFDFCASEINRAIRFKEQYPNTKPLYPLIEKQLTKQDCLAILIKAGIDIPIMYKKGYHNNNCVGCVKGGMGYWNKIRIDFPRVFEQMAQLERELKATCLNVNGRQIYLDNLEPNRGNLNTEITPDCSLFCAIEFENLLDKRVEKIIGGESIRDI